MINKQKRDKLLRKLDRLDSTIQQLSKVEVIKMYDISRFDHLINAAPGNGDSHYQGKIQPQHFSASNRLLFNLSNIIKYVQRYPFKGSPLNDLKKARWYAEYQIIDHDYFAVPKWSGVCISPDDYIAAQPEFNKLQREIPFLIWKYNWQGDVKFLIDAKSSLDSVINSWVD